MILYIINSSFVEVNESLLQNRRIKLALHHPSKLEDYLSNPTIPTNENVYEKRITKFNYVQSLIRLFCNKDSFTSTNEELIRDVLDELVLLPSGVLY
jgi:hypothetical protein